VNRTVGRVSGWITSRKSFGIKAAAMGLIVVLVLVTTSPPVQAASTQIPQVIVYPERNGVYRFEEYIGIPLTSAFYKVNIYVIERPEGLVLVDCGAEDLYGLLIAKINEQFCGKPIIAVLLTHGHADHAGAGSRFLKAGVPVYANVGDAYMISTGNNFLGISNPFSYTGYQPTGFVKDGDIVFGLRVISTPGHTPGSICFYDDAAKVLFSGDTTIAYARDDFGSCDLTFELEYATMLTLDTNSLKAQLGSLRNLQAIVTSQNTSAIFPGHNTTYYGTTEVKNYLSHSVCLVKQVILLKAIL
jgi:glyoxylase-like metal-dependent hydrolase (beta-lactamase superfamily II)